MDKYKDGDTIFILMTAEQCKSVMREWLERDYECDLNVMRSQKNKGKFVLKTKSLMWANRIIQWHGYEKVTYQITETCSASERRSQVKTTGKRVQWQDIPLLRQCANTGDGRLDPWHGCKRERGTPVFYDLQRCRP